MSYQDRCCYHPLIEMLLYPDLLVTESELLGRIKKNKVSKAVFLIQKALLVYTDKATNGNKNQIKSLLEVHKHSLLFEKNPHKRADCGIRITV